ncbi:TAT-binding protein-like protein 7, AAA ATPase [Massospora cicadina]|nr:TAT-binding protein-like protein 7, AAA ATPase [Massospora cicadina]
MRDSLDPQCVADSSRPKRACAINVNYRYSPPEAVLSLRPAPKSSSRKGLPPPGAAYCLRTRSKIDYAAQGADNAPNSARDHSGHNVSFASPKLPKPSPPIPKPKASHSSEADSDCGVINVKRDGPKRKLRFARSESGSEEVEILNLPRLRRGRSPRKRQRSEDSSADEPDAGREDAGRYPKRNNKVQSYARFFGSGLNAFIAPSQNGASGANDTGRKYNFRRMNKETLAKLSHLYSLPEPVFEERVPPPRPKAKANGADDAEDLDEDFNVLLPLNYQEIYHTRPNITLPMAPPITAPVKKMALADIGGLDHQIRTIKEALLLPTLYPDFIEAFGVVPTLTAQALVEECSQSSTPIAFFHINGSDILSKWVGKSEAKIQTIFTVARQWQPSVIFIDEIDGLTPPRSSSDRHNASLVASLLSQMDGIDNSGQILVIGATNRLHAIDPALRRSGRFEEALYFPLPDLEARRAILEIAAAPHNLPPSVLTELAAVTSGYSGADLAALCARAGKNAFFRSHPLAASFAAPVDCSRDLQVCLEDFKLAVSQTTPTSKLHSNVLYLPLPPQLEYLSPKVVEAIQRLQGATDDQPMPYFLPQVLVVTGQDSVVTHHVTSAILDGLDRYKVTQLDLAVFSTSDEVSDQKALKLQLQTMSPKGQRGVALVQHADLLLGGVSSRSLTPLRAALHQPGVAGEQCFLFVAPKLFPELKALLRGLRVLVLNTDV